MDELNGPVWDSFQKGFTLQESLQSHVATDGAASQCTSPPGLVLDFFKVLVDLSYWFDMGSQDTLISFWRGALCRRTT